MNRRHLKYLVYDDFDFEFLDEDFEDFEDVDTSLTLLKSVFLKPLVDFPYYTLTSSLMLSVTMFWFLSTYFGEFMLSFATILLDLSYGLFLLASNLLVLLLIFLGVWYFEQRQEYYHYERGKIREKWKPRITVVTKLLVLTIFLSFILFFSSEYHYLAIFLMIFIIVSPLVGLLTSKFYPPAVRKAETERKRAKYKAAKVAQQRAIAAAARVAKEKAEREAREKAEREAKEKAREKAEREAKKKAKEKAVREAKEKALKEQAEAARLLEDYRDKIMAGFEKIRKMEEETVRTLENTMNEDFLTRLQHDFRYAPHFVASKRWVLDLWGAMGKPKPSDDWFQWNTWIVRIAYAICIRRDNVINRDFDIDSFQTNPLEEMTAPSGGMSDDEKAIISSLFARFEKLREIHPQVFENVCEKTISPVMGLQFLTFFDEEVHTKHPSLYVALVESDYDYGHGRSLLESYHDQPEAIMRVVAGEDEEAVAFDLGIEYANATREEYRLQALTLADHETTTVLTEFASKFDSGCCNPLSTPPIENDLQPFFNGLIFHWLNDCYAVKAFRLCDNRADHLDERLSWNRDGNWSELSVDAILSDAYFSDHSLIEKIRDHDFAGVTVRELKTLLASFGSPTSGNKSELFERAVEDVESYYSEDGMSYSNSNSII